VKQHIAENLLQPALDHWFNQGTEPYLNITWWVSHPLVMLVAVVVLLVLAQGVLGLVSNVIKQLLLLIVKSPYLLLQWLLAKSSISLNLPTPKSLSLKRNAGTEDKNLHARLLTVLNQLEMTKQEQDQVLKELKIILTESQRQTARSSSPAPQPLQSQHSAED
jgi:hypothetical protein